MVQDNAGEDRFRNLNLLVQFVSAQPVQGSVVRRAAQGIEPDLRYLMNALESDPETWRLNRAFHAVHVPSLIAVMTLLSGLDDRTVVTREDQQQITTAFQQADQLVHQARQRVERAMLDKAKIELEVLADYVSSSPAPVETGPRALLDRLQGASVWSVRAIRAGGAGVASLSDRVKRGVAASGERASAVPVLVSNLQKTLTGAVADRLGKPIERRLQASGTALKYGVGTGLGIGVVTAIVFPPLLPLSAGGAVIAALRGWQTDMTATARLGEAERVSRIAALRAERTAALRQLAHGADVFQMETDAVNLTVDVETGDVEAVLLEGDYAGRSWSDLTALEKAEVLSFFAQGADIVWKILTLAGDGS